MKKILTTLMLLLSVSAFAQYDTKGTVVMVRDGDTIVLNTKVIIRLAIVDAPEYNDNKPQSYDQDYGKECKELTSNTVLGKEISYRVVGQSYDRKVAQVFVPGIGDLGKLLIENGCAWLDLRKKSGTRDSIYSYKKSLNEAQLNKIGLWSFPNPINPIEWRRK